MNTQAIHRVTIFGCVVVLAALGLAVSVTGQSDVTAQTDRAELEGDRESHPAISFQPERLTMNGALVYRSGTMLVRNRDNVFATIHTSGLVPGTVVTGWFGIFNNPRGCATSPCTPADFSNPAARASLVNFGGRVVGPDGVADFAEVRAVGDTTNAFLGPGLLRPRRAEIHLAVRTHGPVIPELLEEQLTMFNGGCPPTGPNECATIQVAIHQQ